MTVKKSFIEALAEFRGIPYEKAEEQHNDALASERFEYKVLHGTLPPMPIGTDPMFDVAARPGQQVVTSPLSPAELEARCAEFLRRPIGKHIIIAENGYLLPHRRYTTPEEDGEILIRNRT